MNDITSTILTNTFLSFAVISFVLATIFLLEPIRKASDSKALALSVMFALWTIVFYLVEKGIL